MNSEHIRFLKCFCSSTDFKLYRCCDNKLVEVDTGKSNSIVEHGAVRCAECKRCYIIVNYIISILPGKLTSEVECSLSDSCYLDCVLTPTPAIKKEASDISALKMSEMDARDEQASVYHTYGYRLHGENEERRISDYLHVTETDTVLELGCGTGRITKRIIESGFNNYIAVDFSIESLKQFVDELNGETRDQIFFIVGDVCDLPLKSNIAEKVLTAQVLEHIPGADEQTSFIKECERLVKPEGLLALTVYNYNLKKRFDKSIKKNGAHAGTIYYENFTKRQLLNLVRPYFRIVRVSGINCYFPFAMRLNDSSQMGLERFLACTPISHLLGNILFLCLTKRKESRQDD